MNETVAKIIGADFELANAFLGDRVIGVHQAAQCLLAKIIGYPRHSTGGTSIEFGRRFLESTGSSWYIDSDHLEGNLPEHTSALDHPAILHGAGFAPAQEALRAVQLGLPKKVRLNLLANCSDGRTTWGSHLNILVTRKCFDNLLHSKPHHASFFATHLVTSVPYTGQGMVGAANGRSTCSFQLSQRADWFEKFYGQQTMFDRPLINLRDEPHAADHLARLHIIYFDMVLSPVANILKAGTTQLVLAMMETGWADPTLCLDNPLADAAKVSRDLQLQAKLPTTVRGRSMTALELQQAIATFAGEFVASGGADGIVPAAEQIVSLWLETLDLLHHREINALAGRCDNWLKYLLLDRRRGQRGLSWSSDEMRMADSLFASLDPEVSLFFQAVRCGLVEQMPDAATLDRFTWEPPYDTRAYFRANTLRRYGEAVSSIDWSSITFRVPNGRCWWSFADVPIRDPRRLNRDEARSLFEDQWTLDEFVEAANALVASHADSVSTNG